MSEETKVVKREENNVITRKEENSPNARLFSEFNKVIVSGIIESEFEYSHEVYWEKFYRTKVVVERLSGNKDYIPIMISDLLLKEEFVDRIEQIKYDHLVENNLGGLLKTLKFYPLTAQFPYSQVMTEWLKTSKLKT